MPPGSHDTATLLFFPSICLNLSQIEGQVVLPQSCTLADNEVVTVF